MKTALTFFIGGVIGFIVGESISFVRNFDEDYDFSDDDWREYF